MARTAPRCAHWDWAPGASRRLPQPLPWPLPSRSHQHVRQVCQGARTPVLSIEEGWAESVLLRGMGHLVGWPTQPAPAVHSRCVWPELLVWVQLINQVCWQTCMPGSLCCLKLCLPGSSLPKQPASCKDFASASLNQQARIGHLCCPHSKSPLSSRHAR